MLILTRRIGETIIIGDDVTVTVSAVRGGQVRLCIRAPDAVVVDRAEIRQRKNRQRGIESAQRAGAEALAKVAG